MNRRLWKRVFMALIGVCLSAASVGIFKCADFGTDPYTSLNLGIWYVSGLSYGVLFTILNGVLLVGVFLIKKRYIGIATLLGLLFTGIIEEKCMELFQMLFPEPSMVVRIILLAIALLLMCFSASIYFTADLGVSSYDAWALILSGRFTKIPFRAWRIGTDVVCVTLGALMGSYPGVGTLITAFCMGPLIEFFNHKFSIPLLDGTLFHRKQREKSEDLT